MCRVFLPEDYFACGDGVRDDLPAFTAMIAAMSAGDVAQLAGKTYRLEGTLHVNKRIAIVGEIVNPHYARHRSRLLIPPNTMGLRLLSGATIRDLAIDALPTGTPPAPGTDDTAHGIWCRRTVHLQNVFVQRFGGHGVSLDSRTIERVTSSVSVSVDPSNRSIATAAVTGNTGLLSFGADMEVALFGYTVLTPSQGSIVESATASAVEFELPGAPSGLLAGIRRTINSASVNVVGNVRQCTADVGTGHGLLPNMHITTTDAADSPILSVHRDGRRITFALTTAGPGPAQGDSLTVTRGLIQTIQNCDHWFAENVRCNGNRGHGWHTLGARSNAGCAINLDCTSNYQSGVHEASFLGNTYIACHASNNSADPNRDPSLPPWPSYHKPAEADNNRSKFYNCYSEGSVPAEVRYPANVFAPGPGNWIGDGLAGAFDVSYGRSTLFANRDSAPGRDANLPLNRVDFNVGGPRGAIFSFGAHANELPGPLIEHVCSAVSITNNTATATVTGNTAQNQVRVDTPVTLHGYINNGSSNGMLVSAESPTSIEFPLAGSNGPIPGLTVPLSNVSARGGIATATVPRNHGLLENMRITTSGLSSNDTDALITDVRPTTISYATAGSPTGNGTAVVTRGLLRTVVASSLPYRWHFILDPDPLYQHWFALQYLSASIPPLSGRPTPLALSGVRTADASGARTNVAQIWFPNGFYYGGGQAKQNAEDRGPYRATTYRETGPAPATRAVAWGMGPPSGRNAGTWARGDIVWNANAAIGQPAGWMCIEGSNQQNPAGSWAAMANL
jgi:hypothetical protein